uniref:CD151 molecule n=2 Tax=Equus TaxID=9789 RepID=F6RLK0_HORSE
GRWSRQEGPGRVSCPLLASIGSSLPIPVLAQPWGGQLSPWSLVVLRGASWGGPEVASHALPPHLGELPAGATGRELGTTAAHCPRRDAPTDPQTQTAPRLAGDEPGGLGVPLTPYSHSQLPSPADQQALLFLPHPFPHSQARCPPDWTPSRRDPRVPSTLHQRGPPPASDCSSRSSPQAGICSVDPCSLRWFLGWGRERGVAPGWARSWTQSSVSAGLAAASRLLRRPRVCAPGCSPLGPRSPWWTRGAGPSQCPAPRNEPCLPGPARGRWLGRGLRAGGRAGPARGGAGGGPRFSLAGPAPAAHSRRSEPPPPPPPADSDAWPRSLLGNFRPPVLQRSCLPASPRMGEFNEKKTTCGTVCLKYLLFTFNCCFWLAGLAVMAVGIWTLALKSDYISLLASGTYLATAYILVVAGVVVMVTGVLGCCATFKERRNLLRLYFILLLIIFLLEIIAGVLAYVYYQQLNAELKENLKDTMTKRYHQKGHEGVTSAVDKLQQEFHCCGSNNSQDWRDSEWIRSGEAGGRVVPDSCCKTVVAGCGQRDHASNIYKVEGGCISKLETFIQEHLRIIGAVGIGIACVQVFGMIFTCCLYKSLKLEHY